MASFFLYTLPKSQWFRSIPVQTSSFADQTVIVTGSNTGLGFEAAQQIAHLGAAKIILACRTISKGAAAAEKIHASLGEKEKCAIEVWELDISSYKSIRAFTTRVQSLDRLDAVIQNAGVIMDQFEVIEESEEETVLTTNLVGPALFGLNMLPKLKESSKKTGSRGRLTFVGSDMHYIAQVKEAESERPMFQALNDPKATNMSDRYPTSKLLLYYTVKEIAARSPLSDSSVIITTMTPGFCYSEFGRDMPTSTKIIMSVMRAALARSTEVGGRTLVHAVKPDLDPSVHGKFLMDCDIGDEPRLDLEKRFVAEMFPKLEKIQPGVTGCLA